MRPFPNMENAGNQLNGFGHFVRLNLVREIVEVVGVNPTEITVKYLRHCFTMKRYRVSRVTPEEEAALEKLKHRDTANERIFIFQQNKSGGR